jgi:hypothetical protein
MGQLLKLRHMQGDGLSPIGGRLRAGRKGQCNQQQKTQSFEHANAPATTAIVDAT